MTADDDGLRSLLHDVADAAADFLNQVLFRFADDATTRRVVEAVQRGGDAWMGATTWAGRPAIRLSVSNWQTSEHDVLRAIDAFREALAAESAVAP